MKENSAMRVIKIIFLIVMILCWCAIGMACVIGICALLSYVSHAQPPCVTNCLMDTTIWVSADSAYEVQLRAYCLTAPDTFVNVILWIDLNPGLMYRDQKVEYCSGHPIQTWYDWIGRINAKQFKINP